jgi:hypothetical protein
MLRIFLYAAAYAHAQIKEHHCNMSYSSQYEWGGLSTDALADVSGTQYVYGQGADMLCKLILYTVFTEVILAEV